ncbi:hypothetical protein STENM327S_07676 [Streptomyces tendae]
MTDPGVEVRPLRQITGEAEFNEVFLTDVRIPDSHRLGEIGDGWRVAQTTLNNERVAIGGTPIPREGGMIGKIAETWRERPELRTHDLHQRLLGLWVEAEVARLTGVRLRQQLAAGQPGPEGAGMKLNFARLNQEISGLEVELLGEEGLLYDDWTMRRPELVDFTGRDAGYRYLRSKGNSIEGGTSEVLLNIVAERVLGPARRAPHRQGRRMEGPRPMSAQQEPALLLTEEEEALRAAVRDLLTDHCDRARASSPAPSRPPRTTSRCGRPSPTRMGLAGLLIPEELGGQGATHREAAVVLEELGRGGRTACRT